MLPAKFKPLKGERVEDHHLDRLPYPMYASPKLDGIRVVIVDGVALSASLKPIPNLYVQQVVRANAAVLNGYDGELILGAPNDRPYKRTHSAVMRREGTPTFHIHIFDKWDEYESGTNDRFSKFSKELAANPFVYIVPQYMVHSKDELLKLESHFLDHGFNVEGYRQAVQVRQGYDQASHLPKAEEVHRWRGTHRRVRGDDAQRKRSVRQ